MSGSQNFVKFLRPVARQNSTNYTLRMIDLEVAYYKFDQALKYKEYQFKKFDLSVHFF